MLDFIIVGRGLAGSVLALHLLDRRNDILVIDEPSLSNSTRVAAGLYNPMVFKNLNQIWRADILIPFAEKFYTDQEKKTGKRFWQPKPLARIFSSYGEQNNWQAALGAGNPYLSEEPLLEGKTSNEIKAPFGYGSVNHTGNLDTLSFLDATEKYLGEQNLLLEEKFDYTKLELTDNGWEYGDIIARRIVFCEGWKMRENPFFSWIPFEPVKGEVLTISAPGLDLSCIVNGSCFLLPLGNDLYRIGATFAWDPLNEIPTEEGKNDLLEKLSHFLNVPFTIVDHRAAVRPATRDRRPIIGEHPEYPGMYILNGLGTRGVLIAPWAADHLADLMFEGIDPDPETDLLRFS
jgi:glycine oxidase